MSILDNCNDGAAGFHPCSRYGRMQQRIAELEQERDRLQRIADNNAAACVEFEQKCNRLREALLSIKDRLHNGIKYDEKLNVYVVVWTEREIEQAKEEADEICKRLGFEETT